MRRLRLALGAAAVLMVCAGCGQNDEIGFGGAPTKLTDLPTLTPTLTVPPPDGDPMNPVPPAGATAVPPNRVDASGLPEGYPRVVWTEGDGRIVGAYGQAGGCVEASAQLVEQHAQRVVMRITETVTSTGPCTMELRVPPLTVQLDAPLADRTVVLQHARVGPR